MVSFITKPKKKRKVKRRMVKVCNRTVTLPRFACWALLSAYLCQRLFTLYQSHKNVLLYSSGLFACLYAVVFAGWSR